MQSHFLKFLAPPLLYFSLSISISFPETAYAQETSEDVFTLGQIVQEKILAITHSYRPQSKLATLARTTESTLNANDRKSQFAESHLNYLLLENGLWANEFSSATTVDKSNTTARSLSLNLCGLLVVVSSASVATSTAAYIPPSLYKLLTPFGLRATKETTHLMRIRSLNVSTNSICSPSPGTEFSYQLEREIVLKTSGLFGKNQVATQNEDVRCKVSVDEKPAIQVHNQFRGSFLTVLCLQKQESGLQIEQEYVYLKDSALYLLVRQQDKWGESKISYKDVQYIQ